MAISDFKYPSAWTEDYFCYNQCKDELIKIIVDYIENYETYLPALVKQVDLLKNDFFSGKALYKEIKNG